MKAGIGLHGAGDGFGEPRPEGYGLLGLEKLAHVQQRQAQPVLGRRGPPRLGQSVCGEKGQIRSLHQFSGRLRHKRLDLGRTGSVTDMDPAGHTEGEAAGSAGTACAERADAGSDQADGFAQAAGQYQQKGVGPEMPDIAAPDIGLVGVVKDRSPCHDELVAPQEGCQKSQRFAGQDADRFRQDPGQVRSAAEDPDIARLGRHLAAQGVDHQIIAKVVSAIISE